jgi:hypothetical protein
MAPSFAVVDTERLGDECHPSRCVDRACLRISAYARRHSNRFATAAKRMTIRVRPMTHSGFPVIAGPALAKLGAAQCAAQAGLAAGEGLNGNSLCGLYG